MNVTAEQTTLVQQNILVEGVVHLVLEVLQLPQSVLKHFAVGRDGIIPLILESQPFQS